MGIGPEMAPMDPPIPMTFVTHHPPPLHGHPLHVVHSVQSMHPGHHHPFTSHHLDPHTEQIMVQPPPPVSLSAVMAPNVPMPHQLAPAPQIPIPHVTATGTVVSSVMQVLPQVPSPKKITMLTPKPPTELKKHERAAHTGERPFVCKECNKTFAVAVSLRRHERTHTGERPYKCATCGKRFVEASNLRRHERTHSGEKPYQCKQCDKKFTQSNDLKKHERVHTGEKPYQCSHCEKRFAQSSGARRHERTHVPAKDTKPKSLTVHTVRPPTTPVPVHPDPMVSGIPVDLPQHHQATPTTAATPPPLAHPQL